MSLSMSPGTAENTGATNNISSAHVIAPRIEVLTLPLCREYRRFAGASRNQRLVMCHHSFHQGFNCCLVSTPVSNLRASIKENFE